MKKTFENNLEEYKRQIFSMYLRFVQILKSL